MKPYDYSRNTIVTNNPLALLKGETLKRENLREYQHQVELFKDELLEAKANYEDAKERATRGVSDPGIGTLGMLYQQARKKVEKATARAVVGQWLADSGLSSIVVSEGLTLDSLKDTAFAFDSYTSILSGETVMASKVNEYQDAVNATEKELKALLSEFKEQKKVKSPRVYQTGMVIASVKSDLRVQVARLSVAKMLKKSGYMTRWEYK